MKLGKLWITTQKTRDEYLRLKTKEQKFHQVRTWFSGWRDLEIVWNYIINDTNYGGIERARKDFAEARGTNQYGEPRMKE